MVAILLIQRLFRGEDVDDFFKPCEVASLTESCLQVFLELFGLFGTQKSAFEWTKLAGVLVFIAGIILFKWKEMFQ